MTTSNYMDKELKRNVSEVIIKRRGDNQSLNERDLKRNISENMFKNQKEKIKKMKEKENNLIKRNEEASNTEINNEITMVTLNDKDHWEYSQFEFDIIDGDEVPILNSKFEHYSYLENYSYLKGIELRNVALRCKLDFNYEIYGVELSINLTLQGDASLWIFTRSNLKDFGLDNSFLQNVSFISKNDLTEPDNNLAKNKNKVRNNNDFNDINNIGVLNKYSSIIRIYKEDKSQKCFLVMSVITENGVFKSFNKRQLINYSDIKSNYNIEHDACDLRLSVMDLGDEKIINKVYGTLQLFNILFI